jgi:hypothetical protein
MYATVGIAAAKGDDHVEINKYISIYVEHTSYITLPYAAYGLPLPPPWPGHTDVLPNTDVPENSACGLSAIRNILVLSPEKLGPNAFGKVVAPLRL